MILPTKPIETIHVSISGERAAGILSRNYTMSCFVNPACFDPDKLPAILTEIKDRVAALYSELLDGDTLSPRVLFDYELGAEHRAVFEAWLGKDYPPRR